jgi:hypothetical protein
MKISHVDFLSPMASIGFFSTLRVTADIGAQGGEELEIIDFGVKIFLNFW